MDKINVLEGQGDAYDVILPYLTKNNVSVVKQGILPLTQLYNKDYWRSLALDNTLSLALLDRNHWFYPDDVFKDYVQAISSISFPAVCMFDNPFLHEYQFQTGEFERKLYERSKILSDAIRSRQKKTVIVSPPIRTVDAGTQKRFLDYLMHNRSLFDVYGVHCCIHVTDHSMGFLTGFLYQALTALSKPVWVTRWAIPSREYKLDGKVISSGVPTDNYTLGARNLRTMYLCIDEISPQTKWFFAGACADAFHPSKTVEQCKNVHYHSDSDSWDDEHFLGLVTPAGDIKEPILKSFLDIHSANN